nr:hypothetical protein [Candidatus Sigynarchaeota archaeon]
MNEKTPSIEFLQVMNSARKYLEANPPLTVPSRVLSFATLLNGYLSGRKHVVIIEGEYAEIDDIADDVISLFPEGAVRDETCGLAGLKYKDPKPTEKILHLRWLDERRHRDAVHGLESWNEKTGYELEFLEQRPAGHVLRKQSLGKHSIFATISNPAVLPRWFTREALILPTRFAKKGWSKISRAFDSMTAIDQIPEEDQVWRVIKNYGRSDSKEKEKRARLAIKDGISRLEGPSYYMMSCKGIIGRHFSDIAGSMSPLDYPRVLDLARIVSSIFNPQRHVFTRVEHGITCPGIVVEPTDLVMAAELARLSLLKGWHGFTVDEERVMSILIEQSKRSDRSKGVDEHSGDAPDLDGEFWLRAGLQDVGIEPRRLIRILDNLTSGRLVFSQYNPEFGEREYTM